MNKFAQNIENAVNDYYINGIIANMAKLEVKEFKLDTPILYKYKFIGDDMVEIFITHVIFNFEHLEFSMNETGLYVRLSNGKTPDYTRRLSTLKLEDTYKLSQIVNELEDAVYEKEHPESEREEKKIHFENEDIIITDPCYIIREETKNNRRLRDYDKGAPLYEDYDLITKNGWDKETLTPAQYLEAKKKYDEYNIAYQEFEDSHPEYDDHWSECECGRCMEVLGITNYLTSSTLYGDWSCTTYNKEGGELGKFCADAGLVSVFSLKEVLKYNPDFDYHITKPWTTTLIKNFTGDVWIEKRTQEGVYYDTTKYHKKGDKWKEDSIHVVGEGSVNFETRQTGF